MVVTKSLFQEAPLLFIGVAPPPFEKKGGRQPDIRHIFEWGTGDVAAITLIGVGVRPVS